MNKNIILKPNIKTGKDIIKKYIINGGIATYDHFKKSQEAKEFELNLLDLIKKNENTEERYLSKKDLYVAFFNELKKQFPKEAKGVVGIQMLLEELALSYNASEIKKEMIVKMGSSKLDPSVTGENSDDGGINLSNLFDDELTDNETYNDNKGEQNKENPKKFIDSVLERIDVFLEMSDEVRKITVEMYLKERNKLSKEQKELTDGQFKLFFKKLPIEAQKEIISHMKELKQKVA